MQIIQTIAMHLGDELQNISVEKGYNQTSEDELLRGTDWQKNGYKLFDISCLACSSKNGFLLEKCKNKRLFLESHGI
jgi:hypothetical protein